jgi:hypothetical protein
MDTRDKLIIKQEKIMECSGCYHDGKQKDVQCYGCKRIAKDQFVTLEDLKREWFEGEK